MKIKIGNQEYETPFEVWYANGSFHISWDDGEGGRNYPDPDHQGEEGYDHNEDGKKAAEYIQSALNELATLRAENAALVKEIQEAVGIIERLNPVVKTDFAWLRRNKPDTKGDQNEG